MQRLWLTAIIIATTVSIWWCLGRRNSRVRLQPDRQVLVCAGRISSVAVSLGRVSDEGLGTSLHESDARSQLV